MEDLLYLNDNFNAVIDRILLDADLVKCNLNREDVEKALKSFNGDEIATSVFLKKYALRDDSDKVFEFTLEEAKNRWAEEISSVELPEYS